MIKKASIIATIYCILAAAIGFFAKGTYFSLSILFGGLIMLVNLAGLGLFWSLIFSKKSIALALLTIIFKYLILGIFLWGLLSSAWLSPVGFVLGLTSLLFSVICLALQKK